MSVETFPVRFFGCVKLLKYFSTPTSLRFTTRNRGLEGVLQLSAYHTAWVPRVLERRLWRIPQTSKLPGGVMVLFVLAL